MKQHRPGYFDRVMKIIFQNSLLFVLAWYLNKIAAPLAMRTGGYDRRLVVLPFLIVLACLALQLVALWLWDNEKEQ